MFCNNNSFFDRDSQASTKVQAAVAATTSERYDKMRERKIMYRTSLIARELNKPSTRVNTVVYQVELYFWTRAKVNLVVDNKYIELWIFAVTSIMYCFFFSSSSFYFVETAFKFVDRLESWYGWKFVCISNGNSYGNSDARDYCVQWTYHDNRPSSLQRYWHRRATCPSDTSPSTSCKLNRNSTSQPSKRSLFDASGILIEAINRKKKITRCYCKFKEKKLTTSIDKLTISIM